MTNNPGQKPSRSRDGNFVAVGSNADVEALIGDSTAVTDLAGAFSMPGLVDIHTHPSMSMNFRVFCELPGTFYLPTDEMTIEALKKCIEEYPEDQEWFFAEGYSSPVMKPENAYQGVSRFTDSGQAGLHQGRIRTLRVG